MQFQYLPGRAIPLQAMVTLTCQSQLLKRTNITRFIACVQYQVPSDVLGTTKAIIKVDSCIGSTEEYTTIVNVLTGLGLEVEDCFSQIPSSCMYKLLRIRLKCSWLPSVPTISFLAHWYHLCIPTRQSQCPQFMQINFSVTSWF